MKATGKIMVIAFPDTYVRMSDEWICRVLPWMGLGTKEKIKAGHAAQILVDNKTGAASYYDFGRYVTPDGFGRVRSVHTDAELRIPFDATFDAQGAIRNISDFLYWLYHNPQKTHGDGRVLVSVCEDVDIDVAKAHVHQLQSRGSIPYGAFVKKGSNCSRFVTDTILKATFNKKVVAGLKFNKRFTPSTVGNVEKAATDRKIYQVKEGQIEYFTGSALKENLVNYFHKSAIVQNTPNYHDNIPKTAQKLGGIGSNAWFDLRLDANEKQGYYRIDRYNDYGIVDFSGVFYSESFEAGKPFQFTYDSHCLYCHVLQDGTKLRFDLAEALPISEAKKAI